jgi:hypothetical protein
MRSRQLAVILIQGVAEPPYGRFAESLNLRLKGMGSCQLPELLRRSFRKIIVDSEESIFDYEYLHEFKDKTEKGRTVL